MRLGVVAIVLTVGCASHPGPQRSSVPSAPSVGAPGRPTAHARPETAVRPAPRETEGLRAAMLAALEARAPNTKAETPATDEVGPISALVRDDASDASEPDVSDEAGGARLPPESIQRVVRQNAGRFRDCYQRALLRNSALAGRIVVRFVIGRDGSVARAEEQSASLPDRAARQCVLRSFFDLGFSNPTERRIVVTYPLAFDRDGKVPLVGIPSARPAAEAPPPGFAAAMRAGRRAQPPPPIAPPYVPRTRGVSRSPCAAGDPMCSDF